MKFHALNKHFHEEKRENSSRRRGEMKNDNFPEGEEGKICLFVVRFGVAVQSERKTRRFSQ